MQEANGPNKKEVKNGLQLCGRNLLIVVKQKLWKCYYHLNDIRILFWNKELIKFGILTSIFLLSLYIFLNLFSSALEKNIQQLDFAVRSIGTALLTMSVLIASIHLFVIQINSSRATLNLPKSNKLLFIFFIAFISSTGVIFTTLVENLYWKCGFAMFLSLVTLWMITKSFELAARSVSPRYLLESKYKETKSYIRKWNRWVARTCVISGDLNTYDETQIEKIYQRLRKETKEKNGYTKNIESQINSITSYAIESAKKSEFDTVSAALNVIVNINAEYIRGYEKTSFESDQVITCSLENMRKLFEQALARKSENEIDIAIDTMFSLASVYMDIYITHPATLHPMPQASLALEYITQASKCISPSSVDSIIKLLRHSMRLSLEFESKGCIYSFQESHLIVIWHTHKAIQNVSTGNLSLSVISEGIQHCSTIVIHLLYSNQTDYDSKNSFEKVFEKHKLIMKEAVKISNIILPTYSSVLGGYYQNLTTKIPLIAKEFQKTKDYEKLENYLEKIMSILEPCIDCDIEVLTSALSEKRSDAHDIIAWHYTILELLTESVCQTELSENLRTEIEKNLLNYASVIPNFFIERYKNHNEKNTTDIHAVLKYLHSLVLTSRKCGLVSIEEIYFGIIVDLSLAIWSAGHPQFLLSDSVILRIFTDIQFTHYLEAITIYMVANNVEDELIRKALSDIDTQRKMVDLEPFQDSWPDKYIRRLSELRKFFLLYQRVKRR